MKIYNPQQLSELDKLTISIKGISSLDLMETAAEKATAELLSILPSSTPVVVLCGMGNNAGDGFAIARLLKQQHYQVEVFWLKFADQLSADAQANYNRLPAEVKVTEIDETQTAFELSKQSNYIDCIFGVGLNRPMPKFVQAIIEDINQKKGLKIAIDVPSGMYAHQANKLNDIRFKTDLCLSFHAPKLSFFCSENAAFLNDFKVIDIGLVEDHNFNIPLTWHYTTKNDLLKIYKPRQQFSHKGSFGHTLLIGGNIGMHGSIILSAESALRCGVGKLSVHSNPTTNQALLVRQAEAMTTNTSEELASSLAEVLQQEFDAIGLGMGLGRTAEATQIVSTVFTSIQTPILLDADALYAISKDEALRRQIPPKSILTPHIGELKGLIGDWQTSYEMLDKVKAFSHKYNVIVVVKEAFTKVVCGDQVFINSTGNPALATAGSGDCLSGMITALMTQRYESLNAAILGVYLHGITADLALSQESQESFLASDISKFLGRAFKYFEFEQN